MSLADLPPDVLNIVTERMAIKDIISLKSVCHKFKRQCHCYSVVPEYPNWATGKIIKAFNRLPRKLQNDVYDAKTVSEAFCVLCEYNLLNEAKLLYSLEHIDCNMPVLFGNVCQKGHTETAKWLYSLGGINIEDERMWYFEKPAWGGHLDTMKWIYSFGHSNIHERGDWIIRVVGRYQDIIEWFRTLEPNYAGPTN